MRTSRARPPRGSATGIPTPPASGKLRSHVGSRITTGTSSQPCAVASSHVSEGSTPRKSESTKTKLPPGRSVRRLPRNASERATASSGAVNGTGLRARSSTIQGRSRRPGGTHHGSSPTKSSAATFERPATALATMAAVASASASRFASQGSGLGKSAIDGLRSMTSATVGASSAAKSRTTNSSPRPAGTDECRSHRCRGRADGSRSRRTAARRAGGGARAGTSGAP